MGDLYLFLHISTSWVKIRLDTKNQPPRLSRSALKVSLGGVGNMVQYGAVHSDNMVVQLITLSTLTTVELH